MRGRIAIGVICGIAWGVAAAAVFVAMFSGRLPSPGEVGLPVAIGLVLLYLPFIVAAGLETAAGRASPALAEVIGVTLASGAGLGLLISAGIALAKAPARNRRRRR